MHTRSLLFFHPTFNTVMDLIPPKRETSLEDNFFFLGTFYMNYGTSVPRILNVAGLEFWELQFSLT